MMSPPSSNATPAIVLRPVDRTNWRAVVDLEVAPEQQAYVAEVSRYLALCHYEEDWRPLAIYRGDDVVGFLMWAIDPADGSCWLGGIVVDRRWQGQGCGRAAVQTAVAMLAAEQGCNRFALSYDPANTVARHLYRTLGFVETGEWEDDEMVARMGASPDG